MLVDASMIYQFATQDERNPALLQLLTGVDLCTPLLDMDQASIVPETILSGWLDPKTVSERLGWLLKNDQTEVWDLSKAIAKK